MFSVQCFTIEAKSFASLETPAGKEAQHRHGSARSQPSRIRIERVWSKTGERGALVRGGCESEFCAQRPQPSKSEAQNHYTEIFSQLLPVSLTNDTSDEHSFAIIFTNF